MKILAFLIAELGHVHPLLPTLRHLDRDHDVVVCAAKDLSRHLTTAGMRARSELLPTAVSSAAGERLSEGAAFAAALRDPQWLAAWVESLLLDGIDGDVAAMSAAIGRHRPDVIVADPMLYGAVIAAAQTGVPWAALSSSLNPLTPSWPPTTTPLLATLARLAPRRSRIFRDHGVAVPEFFVSDARSGWLNIAFQTAAYVADRAGVCSVGAPFDDDDVAKRDGDVAFDETRLNPTRRRLYVSFGSQAFHQPDLLRAVFGAGADWQVIASVGSLVDDTAFMAGVPAGSIVARRLPQLRVLRHVDLMVSHGGANSVVEALASAVPVLLMPLCNDQPLQARLLLAAGAGAVVEARNDDGASVDVGSVAAGLQAADAARPRVQQIAQALRAAGGPARAAALVVELAKTQAPVGL